VTISEDQQRRRFVDIEAEHEPEVVRLGEPFQDKPRISSGFAERPALDFLDETLRVLPSDERLDGVAERARGRELLRETTA